MQMENAIESVMDKYSGLITKEQASEINKLEESETKSLLGVVTVVHLLQFIQLKTKAQETFINSKYTISIQDKIYRIFNEFTNYDNSSNGRIIVLGNEGSTIKVRLSGALSKKIDEELFRRGDIILINDVMLDLTVEELRNTKKTSIQMVSQQSEKIQELANLQTGQKNVDIMGQIHSINMSPNIDIDKNSLNHNLVSECVISDLSASIPVIIWDNNALILQGANIGDFLMIEFCNIIPNLDSKKVYANRFSRIVVFKK